MTIRAVIRPSLTMRVARPTFTHLPSAGAPTAPRDGSRRSVVMEEVRMRSRLTTVFAALVLCAGVQAGLRAQAGQAAPAGQKPAPKPHDMTGCLAKGDTATTYRLTNVEGG